MAVPFAGPDMHGADMVEACREVFDRMSWRSESMAEAEAAFALQMRAGLLNPTGDAHEVRMGPAPTVPVDVQMPAVHGMGASPGSFGIPSFGALRGMSPPPFAEMFPASFKAARARNWRVQNRGSPSTQPTGASGAAPSPHHRDEVTATAAHRTRWLGQLPQLWSIPISRWTSLAWLRRSQEGQRRGRLFPTQPRTCLGSPGDFWCRRRLVCLPGHRWI